MARRARGLAAGSGTDRPSAIASTGPRRRNSSNQADDRTLLPALGRRFTTPTDHPDNRTKGVVMKAQETRVARAVGIAALLAGIALGTAVASPIRWIPVQLGSH